MLEAGDNLNRKLDQMLRVSGVGRLRRGLAFYWPSSLPFLLATSRVVVGMSWKAGVAAELIGISMGSIGEAVYQSKLQLNTADLFAWTLVIVLLAYACEKIFLWILSSSSKHTLAWALPKRPNRAPSERSHFEQTENSDDSEKTNLSAAPTKNIGHTDSSVGRICFSHVSFFYIEGKRILTNFSLDIAPQSRICLTNPSGAGKTTVLSLMAGLVRPQEGKISRDGSLAMMFQDTRLLEYATARENVALVAGEYRSSDYIDTLLRSLLDGVDLNCAVENLSGGERRRVELARTLALPADIVLLDEPFTGLDEANRKRAAKVILAQASGTLVVASHDRDSLENLQAQELRM
jgi:NitT/TauT family transport system permease protein